MNKSKDEVIKMNRIWLENNKTKVENRTQIFVGKCGYREK